MRPNRTIAQLVPGLVALAVAGCQRPSDQTTTAAPIPTQVERTARHHAGPATPARAIGSEEVRYHPIASELVAVMRLTRRSPTAIDAPS